MAKHTATQYEFPGFTKLLGTIVPDIAFDELMPMLTPAEWKVVCYIMRRTWGWKKESDNISLSQICTGITRRDGEVLDSGTGLSKQTAITAIKGLINKGVILAIRNATPTEGNLPTTYALRFQDQQATKPANHQTSMREGKQASEPANQERTLLAKQKNTPLSKNKTSPGQSLGQALVKVLDTQTTALQQTALQTSIRSIRSKSVKKSRKALESSERRGTVKSLSQLLKSGEVGPASLYPLRPSRHGPKRARRPVEGTNTPQPDQTPTSPPISSPRASQDQRATARIADFVREVSQEFGDMRIEANISQIGGLYERSRRDEAGFLDWMYVVRAELRERRGAINNPMAYFYSTLRNKLKLAP